MPLSEKGLKETKNLCEKMGVSFMALSDPLAFQFVDNLKNYDSLRKNSLLKPMASRKLETLGVMNHFPAFVFFYNEKLVKPIIHGYETPEGMKHYLQQFISAQ